MLDARKSFRPDDPLRALGIRAVPSGPGGTPLDDSLRQLVAEQLLAGETAEAVLAVLMRRGVAAAEAKAEIAAAAGHPYLKAATQLQARLAKRDWLLEARAKLERMQVAEVPRRERLAPETFFAEHYTTLTPVVLTGMTEDWAGRQWSLDSLAGLGNPEVEVQGGREADVDFELNSIAHKRKMRWHEVLELLRGDPETNDFYVTANNSGVNRKALAALWADVGDLPGYLGKSHLGDGFFWMGPRGTVTPWHHDLTQNLLVNMVGRKRVALVSPAETHRMRNHRHCFSCFGADAELQGVPAAVRPRVLTVEIGPGDILFLPVGWWHHVTGLTMTIGMSFTNFVWDNEFTSFYASEGAL
ncbi:cupin-like domain-containing protein [Sandaracinobacteroides hominis]|uniref:cupin-like domain-containing protein n=1 Tax=Sandaracinobacteroides hominis TaxID=2780086 RepID=UPI0018F63CE9|nr:cupin-like domain-containing protein [Sandaracinobacteroides hominis]